MIYLRDIALHFGARTLFDGVSIAIRPGEKIGLIGRNGSGKSTFLRLLSGQMRPDGGAIELPSGTRIGFLAQTVDLDLNLSPVDVCEQAFAEINRIEDEILKTTTLLEASVDADEQIALAGTLSSLYERQAILGAEQRSGEIEKVLKGMGFTEDGFHRPLSTFSGGWRMRVELARLLLTRPDLLLLDEPTNHLDIESILWFISYLKDFEGTVIVVSHDQHFLDTVTTRTLEVELREVNDYPFPYHKAMAQKEEMSAIKEAAFENQQRQIAHKERLIEKFRAKASKAKFAKALQSELARMDMIELDDSDAKAIRLRFRTDVRPGKVVYRVQKLNKSYGAKSVIRDLDLSIDRGARIAFVGQNGQGKSTLAKILAGVLEYDGGVLETGSNVQLGYYAQDQPDKLPPDKRIIDVLREAAPGETEGRLRNVLGGMLFSGDDVEKKCGVLSGGERSRVAFACMILTPSNVLILDEPTNHLDIQSKEILKQALLEYEGTLLVVSHDLYFLEGLTQHTLEFAHQEIRFHLADIREFLEKRRIDDIRMLEARSKPDQVQNQQKTGQQRHAGNREQRALQKRIQSLENAIEKLEAQIAQKESEMAAPDFYQNEAAPLKAAEYERLRKELGEKIEEWEGLVAQAEGDGI